VSVNISHSGFSVFFSPDDLAMQASVVCVSCYEFTLIAALCNIIYSNVSLYFSFCILFSLMLPCNGHNQAINSSRLCRS